MNIFIFYIWKNPDPIRFFLSLAIAVIGLIYLVFNYSLGYAILGSFMIYGLTSGGIRMIGTLINIFIKIPMLIINFSYYNQKKILLKFIK